MGIFEPTLGFDCTCGPAGTIVVQRIGGMDNVMFAMTLNSLFIDI